MIRLWICLSSIPFNRLKRFFRTLLKIYVRIVLMYRGHRMLKGCKLAKESFRLVGGQFYKGKQGPVEIWAYLMPPNSPFLLKLYAHHHFKLGVLIYAHALPQGNWVYCSVSRKLLSQCSHSYFLLSADFLTTKKRLLSGEKLVRKVGRLPFSILRLELK